MNKIQNKKVTRYPYYKIIKLGNYIYFAPDSITVNTRFELSDRFILENPTLSGNHLTANIRSSDGVGLEIDYLQLWENNSNFGYNALAIATGLVKYYWISEERFDAWIGLGGNYIGGDVAAWGLSAGLGAEYFLPNL